MIIRSRATGIPTESIDNSQFMPAWPAVEAIQKSTSDEYWLVTQPDHAHLSGAIAASFDPQKFPLSADVVEAIRLHDEGWEQFEGCANALRKPGVRDGKPLTFLDATPEIFLKAWSGSIKSASAVSPTGHYIVSAHFRSLAEHRLKVVVDPPESTQRLLDFVERQCERENKLLAASGRDARELDRLVAALQFCDLISLAICAGVSKAIEFPQDLGAGAIRMERENGGYKLHPSPLMPRSLEFTTFQFGGEPLRPQVIAFTLS